jgi:hypothetical protein
MSQTIFLDWNDDRVGTWDGNDFEWQFVAIVIPDTIPTSSGGGSYDDSAARKKRRRRIKLITFIDNKEIAEVKEINEFPSIFIQDAKFVQKDGIKLEIKL